MRIDIPPPWRRALEKVITDRLRKILVLGGEDTGKSTLSLLLIRRLARESEVSLVDADVGQKDLGPPATITLGRAKGIVAKISELSIQSMYFVGSVSPSGHLLPHIIGTKILMDQAETPYVVINTTGFIHGAGTALKTYKIEALNPDAVLALQRRGELEPVLKAFPHLRIFRLPVSRKAVRKSFEERRLRRQRAFQDYFKDSEMIEVKKEEVAFHRGRILKKNLLCGLGDEEGRLMGLGVITECSPEISILTPVEDKIRVIQPGSIYLSTEDFQELPSSRRPPSF